MSGVRHAMILWRLIHLYGLGIQTQPFLLIDEEFLNIFALNTLEQNPLAHLGIDDNGAIAGKLLLDDFEDFLLVELLGKTLDSCQSLTTITLCVKLAPCSSMDTGA